MKEPVRADGGAVHALAIALLAAAPLVAFLHTNHYPLATAEVGLLLLACVAAGLVGGLVAKLGTTVAALVLGAAVALSIDLMYDLGPSKLQLALVPVASLALAWVLRQHIALIVTAASLVFLVTTLIIPGTASGDLRRANVVAGEAAGGASDAPTLVHLILDEHIGIEGLPPELPESAAVARRLTDYYVDRGFRLSTGAYSEYVDTRNSLANLLNFSSRDDRWAHLVEGKAEPYLLKDSAYFQRLARMGYRLHVYQSDHMDFCGVPGVPYAACFGYSAHHIAPLYETPTGTIERARFIFNGFMLGSSYIGRIREKYGKLRDALPGWQLPGWTTGTSRVGPLPVLPVLRRLEEDLSRAGPGNAYFAHLLIPHYPYVLDETCGIRREVSQWLYNVPPVPASRLVQNTEATWAERYRRYFAQIGCQQSLLDRLFESMKETGLWNKAIIIVHGDHGSRIMRNVPVTGNAERLTRSDFNDSFSTLFAVRMPGGQGGSVSGPRSLQQLLGEALGVPVESFPPRVYLRADEERKFHAIGLAAFHQDGDRSRKAERPPVAARAVGRGVP
jgi:hypothetical protein